MALIYIVEDDENIREIETIALKNSNYMVCAFEKATTFYKKLEDIMPDLVLWMLCFRMRAGMISCVNCGKILRQRNCRSLW